MIGFTAGLVLSEVNEVLVRLQPYKYAFSGETEKPSPQVYVVFRQIFSSTGTDNIPCIHNNLATAEAKNMKIFRWIQAKYFN